MEDDQKDIIEKQKKEISALKARNEQLQESTRIIGCQNLNIFPLASPLLQEFLNHLKSMTCEIC